MKCARGYLVCDYHDLLLRSWCDYTKVDYHAINQKEITMYMRLKIYHIQIN